MTTGRLPLFFRRKGSAVCRNIHTLYNYEPPATETKVRLAALQYVRKVSGFRTPSKANVDAFETAVHEVELATAKLLDSLVTHAPARDREVDAARARERSARRRGQEASHA